MAAANSNGLHLEGGCSCQQVRYSMTATPLFVHCCHCFWCQRESGAAFALNAMVESENVTVLHGEPEMIETPTESGRGQRIARCPSCKVALWSFYAGAGPAIKFIRVGTLDQPGSCPPDIHIFTSSKQSWVELDGEIPVVENYYRRSLYWPSESVDRFKAAISSRV